MNTFQHSRIKRTERSFLNFAAKKLKMARFGRLPITFLKKKLTSLGPIWPKNDIIQPIGLKVQVTNLFLYILWNTHNSSKDFGSLGSPSIFLEHHLLGTGLPIDYSTLLSPIPEVETLQRRLVHVYQSQEPTVLHGAFQWTPTFLIWEALSQSIFLGFKQTLKASGVIVIPAFPFKDGSVSPSGTVRSKQWSRQEKYKNSSIRAKTSPRHIRRPTPNGKKYSGFVTFPSEFMNLDGLNCSGLSHKFGSIWIAWSSGTT